MVAKMKMSVPLAITIVTIRQRTVSIVTDHTSVGAKTDSLAFPMTLLLAKISTNVQMEMLSADPMDNAKIMMADSHATAIQDCFVYVNRYTLVSGDKNKLKCPPIRTRTSFGKSNMSADKTNLDFWEMESVRR